MPGTCCGRSGSAPPGSTASWRSRPSVSTSLVTEFVKDAAEIGEAAVDDIIDQGLAMIRKLRDAGLAHRDIKPGNLMVRSGELAADRRVLRAGPPVAVAACSRPGQHDAGARATFRPPAGPPAGVGSVVPDELAEAFAATRGVASPTQLRAFMNATRGLPGAFRALAPPRPPVVPQRWSASAGRPGRHHAGHRRRRVFHSCGLCAWAPGAWAPALPGAAPAPR
jgi:hypothetical protein